LISKGGVSMDGNPLNARGKSKLKTDSVWLLTRPESDSRRVIWLDEESITLRLTEDGFVN